MKTLHTLFLLSLTLLSGVLATSCDRMDDNGPFEGYWLLVEREGYEAPTASDDILTWGVRNELIQVSDTKKCTYYMTFRRTADELVITTVSANDGTNDVLISCSDIPAKFCFPADGRFEVVRLTTKEMILQTPQHVLHFKKN